MQGALARFLQDESGATTLEYAIIGSVVSIMIVAAALAIGSSVNGMLDAIAGRFN